MGTDRLVCDVSNYNEMFKLPYCEPIAEPRKFFKLLFLCLQFKCLYNKHGGILFIYVYT